MLNKLDAALNFHQTALSIRNQRQELLASNIANADTPHYKARDIDFQASLQAALQQHNTPATSAAGNQLQASHPAHLGSTASASYAAAGEPLFRPVMQGSVDGNTVDMDVERNAYVDNGIRYEASLTMITGQIKKMLTAINGQ